jgi:hypothetical protein
MTETMTKLNQPMPFPLDLSDIVVTNQNNDNDNKEKVDNADDDHNDCSSELQAVVIHIGRPCFGTLLRIRSSGRTE